MQSTSLTMTAPFGVAVIVFLAGCAGGAVQSPVSVPLGPEPGRQSLGLMAPDGTGIPKELAVADDEDGAGSIVYILNKAYKVTGTISTGLKFPVGDFIDNRANLYVANATGPNVTEYPKGATSPSFTYSSGLIDPNAVTTDTNGNVFVADYGGGRASVVVEYPQGSNTPKFSCSSGLANDGVAVDAKGDVFVSGYDSSSHTTHIAEYAGGLSGCSGQYLGASLAWAGAMQVDDKSDIVACDFNGNSVDIIAPPYNTITSKISVSSLPFSVALNKKNSLVYISLPNLHEIVVDDYPSGTNVTTLGSQYGFIYPVVATYPFEKK